MDNNKGDNTMTIQELVEEIAARGNKGGMFYFTMEDTSSPMYPTAADKDGKEVVQRDYWGLFTETKFIHKVDDAIAFLFDCDIHLWELMSWEIKYDEYSVLPQTWNITLRRYNNGN